MSVSTVFSLLKEVFVMFWTAITTLVPAEIIAFFNIKSAVDSTAQYFDAFDTVIYVLTGISAIIVAIRFKLRKAFK